MGIEDMSMRNGRTLSDQWADSVVVRPRTTEQHITVHKRLVLGFAISILTLIIVTAIAITLSVSFERCAAESSGALTGNGSSNSKSNQSRDRNISHRESKDVQQPWRHPRLPGYQESKTVRNQMRIHRRFHYQPNQMYVIALHREMKPLRTYKINITFDAQIENELLGFFRSS